MINEAFFNNFVVENTEYDSRYVVIILKSKLSSSNCPCCGQKSSRKHSKYLRTLLDLLMIDKYTQLKLVARRFYCDNDDCSRKIFSEQFGGFVGRYNRITERLANYLVKIGLSQSANQSCRVIKETIPVSASSLLRLVRKHNINVSYDSESIGIDDFSFKRGITFGTIICDLKTGKPINIISSRNLEEVTEHLKLYKNVQLVSRDRSTTYAKAIKEAIPNATQVADRFHIIHNFFEGISDFLKRYIGKALKIIIDENNVAISKDTNVVHTDKYIKKLELIKKVRELHNSGMPIKTIVRDLYISRNTVRKYINMENIESLSFYEKPTSFYMYKDFIINMLINKKTYKEILFELEKKSIKYSYSALAKYANALKKEGLPQGMKTAKSYIFTRFNLMKIFWNFENSTTDLFKLLASIINDFPLIDNIFMAIATLKYVYKSKDVSKLQEWLGFNNNSEIKEIRSFIGGVEKDYISVENSVIFNESNGTLEGNVNRLKVIKRSMFGRANFDLLRKKYCLIYKVIYNLMTFIKFDEEPIFIINQQ